MKAVRARPDWDFTTLMMVTTESEIGQIVRALAAGAHEYVRLSCHNCGWLPV